MFKTIYPFIISLVIGLLIGIERERNIKKRLWVGGIRTFILFALLGTLIAKLDQTHITIITSIFVFAMLILSYFRASSRTTHAKDGVGITTELAAGIVYILGYLTLFEPKLTIALGIIVLAVLFERDALHTFSREKLKAKEIKAAIIILIIALTILPILPAEPIDHYKLINLQKICMLIVVLAGMQFGGYVALRAFGVKLGYLFMGFFGGLVSSTALFATVSKSAKKSSEHIHAHIAACLAAISATLIQSLVIVAFISTALFKIIFIPIILAILASSLIALAFTKKSNGIKLALEQLPNPLDLKSVLKLAFIIFLMYILVALSRQFLGIQAVSIVTFLGGLFETHSVVLANAMLFSNEKLSLSAAADLIYIAVISGFISKYILVWVFARNRFALDISLLMFLIIAIGVGSCFLIRLTPLL